MRVPSWRITVFSGLKERTKQGVQHLLSTAIDPVSAKLDSLEETRDSLRLEGRLAWLESETGRARRAALLSCELQGFERSLRGCSGKRILVAGWYGADNLGDELMMRSVLERLPEEALCRTAVLLWDNPTYGRLNVDARVHPIHYPATTRELDSIVDYFDVVIWGGGAILDDGQFNDDVNNFNTSNLFIRINELMIARGKDVYCLGLSTNEEISDKAYIEHLRRVVAGSRHFSLRDPRSKEILVEKGISSDQLTECDDLVFALRELGDGARAINDKVLTLGFVFLHTWDLLDTYANVVKACVEEASACAEGRDVCALLIPFMNDGHYDENMNEALRERLAAAGVEVELAGYSPKVAESPILRCDALVSYKYHSALIACCYGIPCLLVSRDEHPCYANKMHHLADLAGVGEMCVGSGEFEESPAELAKRLFMDPAVPRIDPLLCEGADRDLTGVCSGL